MATSNVDVLLFGDLAVDTYPYLRQLLTRRDQTAVLSSFVNHVSSSLRTDISSLSRAQRQALPSFHDLLAFVEAYRAAGYRTTAIDNTLLCFAQLAHWIGLAEESPDSLSAKKCIIGQNLGLISASAVSSFTSLSAFIPTAVEHVRAAFRLGIQVDSVVDRIHSSSTEASSWSKLAFKVTPDEARRIIADFVQETSVPLLKAPYVSAVTHNGVTISGPPEIVDKLFETTSLRDAKSVDTGISGAYHAPHLYAGPAVESILASGDSKVSSAFRDARPKMPVVSSSSGNVYKASTCENLLEQVIKDILIETSQFGAVLDKCKSLVGTSICRVVPIGPSLDAEKVVQYLQENGNQVSLFETALGLVQRREAADLKSSKIAIVGMSGRFPGGNDIHEFWEMLQKGLDMHKEVPADRFDAQAHYDPSGKGKNKSHTPFGNFIENAGLFDPRFFNMSPREATQTDPMQRLAIMTAYEALEMSGYVANRTPSTKLDRIGTFYGQTSDDWREINEAQDIDTYFITGGVRAFGPGRINYYFKFSGPSFSVDTACSSSMAALQLACTSLWAGDCDTAITGGLNVLTNPDIFSGLSKGQFLSKTGNCQTFDNDADGYCRGDGIGTVILKRLEDAEADNDNILGVILATATNHSAEAVSITHPHAETQEALYKKVLDQAGVDAHEVGYVEMHGTGTQAGDGTEMTSVTNVFAPASRRRRPDQRLYLSSVKANIGHGEAASGVCALIKVLLMLRHSIIPPHAGIKREINKTFPQDLAERNVHIARKSTPFPRGDGRIVYVNNFSAAGGNTALLIEDGPRRHRTAVDPRPSHVVTVSARALSSLKGNLQRLGEYIETNSAVSLPSLSYTTSARRIQHNYKISFNVSDLQQLKGALAKAAGTDIEPTSSAPNVAFTFTGQGSHYAKLAADLFETSSTFRADVLSFNAIATSLGYPSFLPLIDGSVQDVAAFSPLLVQVGLTSVQIALCRLWISWGVKPSVVIGHSLGEYAALYAAGIVSISDAIYLVGERARLLESKCTAGTHAMLAIKSAVEPLQNVINATGVEIACINGPSETVLSGTTSNVESAKSSLEAQGMKCTKLNVPYAFHSSQVDAILPEFVKIASGVTFNQPKLPLMSPLLSTVQKDAINPTYLARHAREAVNYLGALSAGQKAGLLKDSTVFLEIGPHPVTLGFVKAALGASTTGGPSLKRNDSAWSTIASTASLIYNKGVEIDWNEYHRDFVAAHELLELPAYSFALKNYWIDYKNNWCLTKGDPVATAVAAVAPIPKLSTTTVQNVVQEEYSEGKGLLVAESDIHRSDLWEAISGHKVNGAPLFSSSLYCDIGITVGQHMWRRVWNSDPEAPLPGINVADMEVPRSLVGKPGTEQILEITAKADKTKERIHITFSTGTTEHGTCVVEFGDKAAWETEWSRTAYLVEDRVQLLQTRAEQGKSHVLLSGMAYKLFAALVDYEGPYRGMQHVIFDASNIEATAKVVLQKHNEDQKFALAPYWIDSFGHISGFCVNANDELDSKAEVFISHGWKSMRLSRAIELGKEYRSYVRMLPDNGKMYSGDVYLFDGSEVIGVWGGVTFQCIPRRILDIMLPPVGGAKKAAPAPVAAEPQTVKATATVVEKTAKSAKVTTVTVTASGPTVTSQVMDIIAEECGVALSELADGNSFADLGVDSLMQLAISGRMRESLDLDIHSTLFVDYPTIGALKQFLGPLEKGGAAAVVEAEESSGSTSPSSSQFHEDSASSASSSPVTPPDNKELQTQDKVARAVEVIHSQRGIDSTDASSDLIIPTPATTITITPAVPAVVERKAQSIILQGSPKTAVRNFFLIPDGGGSATSYVPIPTIDKDMCVFGLNSPYMKTPEEYTCGVTGIATLFVNEMKRRQPTGPYVLGGWSAGGVIAYECVQQLLRSGSEVSHLVLIDSPCPLIIEPLPITLHQWFNSIGLLGDPNMPLSKKLPAWLLPHFQASITALSTYNARTLWVPEKAPKTVSIWCEDGICKTPEDPRPDPYPYGHAQWLLENKTDFGPQLWDVLLGKGRVETMRVGGNHFTMMKGENAQQLGDRIRKALCE